MFLSPRQQDGSPYMFVFLRNIEQIVIIGKIFSVILWTKFFLPNYVSYKIFRPKNIIHQHPQTMLFMIINRDKNSTVFSKEFLLGDATGATSCNTICRVVPYLRYQRDSAL